MARDERAASTEDTAGERVVVGSGPDAGHDELSKSFVRPLRYFSCHLPPTHRWHFESSPAGAMVPLGTQRSLHAMVERPKNGIQEPVFGDHHTVPEPVPGNSQHHF